MLKIPNSLISAQHGATPTQIDAIRSGNAVFLATKPSSYHPTLRIDELATELCALKGLVTQTTFGNDVFMLSPDGPYTLDMGRFRSMPGNAFRFSAEVDWLGGTHRMTETDTLGLPGYELRTESLVNLSLRDATRRGLYRFTAFLNVYAGNFTEALAHKAIEDLLTSGMRQGGDDLAYSLSDFIETKAHIRATIRVPKGHFTRTIFFLKPDAQNPEPEWSFTPFRWSAHKPDDDTGVPTAGTSDKVSGLTNVVAFLDGLDWEGKEGRVREDTLRSAAVRVIPLKGKTAFGFNPQVHTIEFDDFSITSHGNISGTVKVLNGNTVVWEQWYYVHEFNNAQGLNRATGNMETISGPVFSKSRLRSGHTAGFSDGRNETGHRLPPSSGSKSR